jgi:cell wall-associated NlpC family hydrolase
MRKNGVPPLVAIRLTRRLPLLAVVVAALCGTAAVVPVLAAAAPQPTATSVENTLTSLAKQNTELVEKYDQAQVALAKAQQTAAHLQSLAKRASGAYQSAEQAMSVAAAAEYEGGSFSTAGALLSSPNGDSYLDALTTISMITAHFSQIANNLDAQHHAADKSAKAATSAVKVATKQRDALGKRRTAINAQMLKYRALLDSLTTPQRAVYQASITPSFTSQQLQVAEAMLTKSHDGAAAAAVRFALAQVGKPYSWGSAGPYSYDCSGLTMASWAQAGVALPHSAAEQYDVTRHIPESALQPGDLVFFYSPIGHVTIYIGNGLMVSAPTYGEPVSVIPLNSLDQVTGYGRVIT